MLLLMPMMVGMGRAPAGGGGGTDATIAFTDGDFQNTVTTAYTFTAKNIGAADSTRIVAVGLARVPNGAQGTISVTIGGVLATQRAASTTATQEHAQIWTAPVPTGTTADIVITGTTNHFWVTIAVWAILNATETPTATIIDEDSNPATGNLNVAAGGVACSVVVQRSNASPTFTWSGLTENLDAEMDTAGDVCSMASGAFASAQTPLAVSATSADGGVRSPRLCAVSFPKA